MAAEPHLRRPTARVRHSFLDAVAEFRAEGLTDRTRDDQEIPTSLDLTSPDGFSAYLQTITTDALDESRLPTGWVPSTRLWWTCGEHYLGRVDVRHRLTPALTEVGGHIGYAVRPSARRQGHATAMLLEALVVARALGLERALVTCDVDNVASRRVIEHGGGRLEDQRGQKLRFWIET